MPDPKPLTPAALPSVPQPVALAEGFYQHLDFVYLQQILSSLQQAQQALSSLESRWRELMPSQKRTILGRASAALNNAESSVTAISGWRGNIGAKFQSQMKKLREEAGKPDVTAPMKVDFLRRKLTIIERTMLDCDVILEPRYSQEEIFDSVVSHIAGESTPVVPDRKDITDIADPEAEDDDKLDAFDDELEDLEEDEDG